MKKLIFIAYVDKNLQKGVYNKVVSQAKAFSKYYETILIYKNDLSLYELNINREKENILIDIFESGKIIHNINIFNNCVEDVLSRYNLMMSGIRYAKNFKFKSKGKIIYEIPTFPYLQELWEKKRFLKYFASYFIDKRMEKISDLIPVVLGKEMKFKSNKYISIYNGIEHSNLNIKKYKKNNGIINLIAIANVDFWHGYDRVIIGLRNYYDSNYSDIVYFNIVGDGEELENLKSLVKELRLNEYVIFHGNLVGEDLDKATENSDIGIGSIANHRKGLDKDSALKNREYCMRGIPFIISSIDDAFVNFKYAYRVPKDDSPLIINDILEFYYDICKFNYGEEMNDYAKENLTWDSTIQPIIDFLTLSNNA